LLPFITDVTLRVTLILPLPVMMMSLVLMDGVVFLHRDAGVAGLEDNRIHPHRSPNSSRLGDVILANVTCIAPVT
jgi:hypothetical protein